MVVTRNIKFMPSEEISIYDNNLFLLLALIIFSLVLDKRYRLELD